MNDYSKVWGKYSAYISNRNEDCSEKIILSLCLQKFKIESMVDFGCAIGRWCREGKKLGIAEVLGLDGEYVDSEALVIDKSEFMGIDLGEHVELSKRYDLAVSLEVAEHLPEDKSDIFVDNLVRASDHILFSAAVPGQGGDFHVNEKPLTYWQKKFERNGYYLCDCLRPVIWENDSVIPMYRQNCVLFIKEGIEDNSLITDNHIIVDIVHPEMFKSMAHGGIMLFPFHQVRKNSKIVLYGAGTVGKQYYSQLHATKYCEEVIWVDGKRTQACVENQAIDIQPLEILTKAEADYYIVAIEDENMAQEIVETLNVCYNIALDKIIYQAIRITRY